MDIATKAARIRSGHDSQHGSHRATPGSKPRAHALIREGLRRDAEAWRVQAPKAAPRSRPTAGEVATASGAAAPDAASRQAASLPEILDGLSYRELQRLIREINQSPEREAEGIEPLRATGPREDLIAEVLGAYAKHLALVGA